MPRAFTAAARRAPIWRAFAAADCQEIDRALRQGGAPCCPACATTLEARGSSRLAPHLPAGTAALDLECRWCRRFRCVVRSAGAGDRLERLRRLALAVSAAGTRPARRRELAAAAA